MAQQGTKKAHTKRRQRDGELQGGHPLALSPFAMERTLRDVHRILEGKEFASIEEAEGFLSKLTGGGLEAAQAKLGSKTPKQQAQQLAYEAMEAESTAKAQALASKAVALDPDCVDALVTLASATAGSEEEYIRGLQKAVAAGERSLGAEFFQESKGHFWGILETRPYMRARHLLADLLDMTGRTAEAIRHFEAMLELNPNDNQGVRDNLLACYLITDNLEGARRLFREYKEDCSALFNWARTLGSYLSGNREAAVRALKQARKDNPHVEGYLTGKKRLPEDLPDTYAFGSEEEAIVCADMLFEAWLLHPLALKWLFDGGRAN